MQIDKERWTSAVFRICSETKSIEDICATIHEQPTKVFKKGTHCIEGNPKSHIREVNLWLLKSKLSDQEPLEAHIEHFLSFLKENAEGIGELQTECEFDIFCGFSSQNGQGGFTLDHKILKELTAYPVDLCLDLYPPSLEESNEM